MCPITSSQSLAWLIPDSVFLSSGVNLNTVTFWVVDVAAVATGAKVFCCTQTLLVLCFYLFRCDQILFSSSRSGAQLHSTYFSGLRVWPDTDCSMSPVSVFLLTESSPSSARGPTSSRSTRLPRRTGSPPVNMLSPCPTSMTVPGMYIESSAWTDPRCVYLYTVHSVSVKEFKIVNSISKETRIRSHKGRYKILRIVKTWMISSTSQRARPVCLSRASLSRGSEGALVLSYLCGSDYFSLEVQGWS